MTTLVTGAAGHVGANLVRELLARGRTVRVLVKSDTRGFDGLPVERVNGDITAPETLEPAFEGVTVCYHTAAFISVDGRDHEDLYRVNIDGTKHVIAQCRRVGARLVHFSSIHALSEFPLDQPVDESRPLAIEDGTLAYSRTKASGEKVVLDAVAEGLDAVIVNPTGIVGPHDYKLSHMGETVRDLAARRLPALIPGAYDFVDVRDVVAGALAAEERGKRGERYILSGHYVTVRELAESVHRVTGARPPRMTCPMWLARMVAPPVTWFSLMAGVRPKFTSSSLAVLRSNGRTTYARANRELGYEPRPLDETIAATVEWLRGARFL
ncbi:MAG: SDR family oxidoreductase [Deltaproteobacteria bacterium]|nr:SDR family oxidoreductase [Deltaproteobacteria bacterium]